MSRLLNESWLEGLPDNIVSNLEALNNYVVQRICERIKKIGDIGAADANRLKTAIEYAGADLKAIEKEVARIMGMNQQEVERLFEEVAEENVEFANTYYRAKNMDTLQSYTSRSALSSFVEAATLIWSDLSVENRLSHCENTIYPPLTGLSLMYRPE